MVSFFFLVKLISPYFFPNFVLGIHAGIRDLEIYLTEKDMCALPFTSVEGPIIHHSNHALYGVLSVHLKSRLSFGSESYNESDNIRGKLFISNYVLDNLKEKFF